jgi:7-cyano-7-deazaguanine reductase|tara:strand:- start:1275 stop:1676 length:402 start_codon:yes stop_codon:yes gene_type:complete
MMGDDMLGREVGQEEYGTLVTFPIAAPVSVQFFSKELQALCPAVPGVQPDIYELAISYTAVTHAIESKSLKLWLTTYRDQRIFAEHLVIELHDHVAALEPMVADVSVRLEQNIRGGIVTVVRHPSFMHLRKDQ